MKFDYDSAVARWAWPHLQNGISADRLVNVLSDDCGYSGPIARRVISAIEAPEHNNLDLVFPSEPAKPSWAPGDTNRSVIATADCALVFASLDPHLELVAGVLTAAECDALREFTLVARPQEPGALASAAPMQERTSTDPGFAPLSDEVRRRISHMFNWPLAAVGPLQLWAQPEATESRSSLPAPVSRAVLWLCLDVVDAASALEVFNLGMLVRPRPGYGLLVGAEPTDVRIISKGQRAMASVSFDALAKP